MRILPQVRSHPEWVAVRPFLALILMGAILLAMPFASSRGQWTDVLTALFTATSATCVTGLATVDIGTHFSPWGQAVILLLIQLGGLGIMTLTTFLLALAGRRLSIADELVMRDAIGMDPFQGTRPLLRRAVVFTAGIELTATAIVAGRLWAIHAYPFGKALYHGLFHSVSAFCNAGFSLYPDNLIRFVHGPDRDLVILLALASAIVLGGIGFLVLYNVSGLRPWRLNRLRRGRLSLHSALALGASAVLIAAGWAAFAALERDHTLAGMSTVEAAVASLFQSVSPRTAGYNVVDLGQVQPPTLFMTMGLMFIGGSPSSTAGGVKTTTAVILVLTVVAMLRGREETELRYRSLPVQVVRQAITIFILGVVCVAVFFAALMLTEHAPAPPGKVPKTPDNLLFEAISALGTVGLSTGITPDVTPAGQVVLILAMFLGRLGTLVVALTIGRKDVGQSVQYPEEEVVVG